MVGFEVGFGARLWARLIMDDVSWPIGAIATPGFGRKGLVHNVISFADSPFAVHGFDDEVRPSPKLLQFITVIDTNHCLCRSNSTPNAAPNGTACVRLQPLIYPPFPPTPLLISWMMDRPLLPPSLPTRLQRRQPLRQRPS